MFSPLQASLDTLIIRYNFSLYYYTWSKIKCSPYNDSKHYLAKYFESCLPIHRYHFFYKHPFACAMLFALIFK